MKKVYILLGDDKSGKTTFQKYLIEELLGIKYDRMQSDLLINIGHTKCKYHSIYFIGRSIQERDKVHQNIKKHVNQVMQYQDACFFFSSHLVYDDIIKLFNSIKVWTDNITFIYLTNNKYPFLEKLIDETKVRQHYVLINPYQKNWRNMLKLETKSFIARELNAGL